MAISQDDLAIKHRGHSFPNIEGLFGLPGVHSMDSILQAATADGWPMRGPLRAPGAYLEESFPGLLKDFSRAANGDYQVIEAVAYGYIYHLDSEVLIRDSMAAAERLKDLKWQYHSEWQATH